MLSNPMDPKDSKDIQKTALLVSGASAVAYAIAETLGIKYQGMQEQSHGPPKMTFTDPQTNSTFMATDLNDARVRLTEMRAKFRNPPYDIW